MLLWYICYYRGDCTGCDFSQKFLAGDTQICYKQTQFAPKCPDWSLKPRSGQKLPLISAITQTSFCMSFTEPELTVPRAKSLQEMSHWIIKPALEIFNNLKKEYYISYFFIRLINMANLWHELLLYNVGAHRLFWSSVASCILSSDHMGMLQCSWHFTCWNQIPFIALNIKQLHQCTTSMHLCNSVWNSAGCRIWTFHWTCEVQVQNKGEVVGSWKECQESKEIPRETRT